MAGLAFLLKQRGLSVSGCDLQMNRQTEWLCREGVEIRAGHNAQHVDQAGWLVRSTAVPVGIGEIRRALEQAKPVVQRGLALAALMRERSTIAVAGSHGKTTTTAMIAQLLGCGYCIGGEMAGSPAVAKDAELMVVEVDESDGTLVHHAPDYCVITNIDYDHMEYHASQAVLVDCFRRLVDQTRKRVFYSGHDGMAAELCAGRKDCTPFYTGKAEFDLPFPGTHNRWNAAAAAAVCRLWITPEQMAERMARLRPVRRRFETVYHARGIRIVLDYAHHPAEIKALVQSAQALEPARLLAIFQPHRYTRTKALKTDFPGSFKGINHLAIAPVYAAWEPPLEGGESADLAAAFPNDWGDGVAVHDDLPGAWKAMKEKLRPGDLLLLIGAGDIDRLAKDLPGANE